MDQTPDPRDQSVADAEAKLARLGAQVDSMQALLVRLLQDVVRAETYADHPPHAAELVEVNEQLLMAALTSRADAEAASQQLKRAAEATALDALTRLPTRTTLLDRFALAIAHAKRHGSRVALLFLDLDNFKQVNDTFGHAFGDKVLVLVAERMLSVVRGVDTVSRHGGDEFLILLTEISQPGDAATVADKLIAAVGAPAEVDGQAVIVTASVGIAIYPDNGDDVDTLVARADAAMYATKRRRPGGIAFHAAGASDEPELIALPGFPQQSHDRDRRSDATDYAQTNAHLREANERLVLAALTAQELREAAEQAQQRQTAFLAAVAEELRDPMAPIRIATAMLGHLPTNEPLLPRVQSIVEQQMAHISRLLANVVDASNAGTGELELDRRCIDLAEVIDAAIAAHRLVMDARGQRFEVHRPPDALYVQGDAARLEQIISNLLDNASKHTRDGGRISLTVVATDLVTLTVSDNGIGITPQMLPRVFEPFEQDTRALGFHGVGLGIGLTAARALVRAHGGNLVAHSAGTGRGSQFVVTLPLATGAPAAPAAGSAAAESRAERESPDGRMLS